jgi:hypothetical protein
VPAHTDNDVFKQPTNPDIKVWRYMDFTKYVSMLDSSSLFFARADLLGDSFEGSSPKVNIALRPTFYRDTLQQMSKANPANQDVSKEFLGFLQFLSTSNELNRYTVYVNSWHMNEYESAAMWHLYATNRAEAIAVQTTYARSRDCLPSGIDVGLNSHGPAPIHIGEVQYIDYHTEWFPEGNLFYPFVHKRKSFEHEREVRAVLNDAFQGKFYTGNDPKKGYRVEVSIDNLIERVYVAPTAPDWFRDLVEAVTGKYGFSHKPINRSSLSQRPIY